MFEGKVLIGHEFFGRERARHDGTVMIQNLGNKVMTVGFNSRYQDIIFCSEWSIECRGKDNVVTASLYSHVLIFPSW